jgi:UDP-glucose 4-epimerase
MRIVLTGGAGFLGSHLADKFLAEGHDVIVIDNFTTGHEAFVDHNLGNPKYTLIRKDLFSFDSILPHFKGVDIVFHMAANADVRHGLENTRRDLEQNTIVTYNVLEAMQRNNVKTIVFSSTGSIYGEPDIFPTPETYPFPIQTSFYGASKLACEGLIEAFCEGFGMRSHIFRFVSTMGERYTHGCVFDFMQSLRENPSALHILGNGKQRKSYIYIKDLIDAIFHVLVTCDDKVTIFNLGTDEFVDVDFIAKTVFDELKLADVTVTYGGGTRGWVGDSPFIYLSIAKLRKAGFTPTTRIEEAIRHTIRYLHEHPFLFEGRQ